jgi:hypothetical protein
MAASIRVLRQLGDDREARLLEAQLSSHPCVSSHLENFQLMLGA